MRIKPDRAGGAGLVDLTRDMMFKAAQAHQHGLISLTALNHALIGGGKENITILKGGKKQKSAPIRERSVTQCREFQPSLR